MATKITGYRFDEDFINLTENIDRLEERHKKMNKMGFWVN